MRSIRSANLARRGPGIGRYRGRVLTGPQIWRLAGPGSVDIADALRPVRQKRPACRQAVRRAEVPGKVVCGVFGRANRPLLRGAEETRYDTDSPCRLLFGMFAQV